MPKKQKMLMLTLFEVCHYCWLVVPPGQIHWCLIELYIYNYIYIYKCMCMFILSVCIITVEIRL